MSAVFAARQAGVMACGAVVRIAVHAMDPSATVTIKVADGEAFEAGTVLVAVEANARALLAAERTALNLLGRMCGIATETARYRAEIEGTSACLIDTRKTTPGLRMLEKHAVVCGGGVNHRLGLDNGVMLKDNHIAVAGSITNAVKRARQKLPILTKIEVECDRLEQVREAADAGARVVLFERNSGSGGASGLSGGEIYIGGGGAAMPEAVAQRLLDQFGLRYVEGYGLTETAAPSHTNPPDAPKRQCLGIPFIGVDSRVVDPDTLQELSVGESGEIVTHGPQVFKGYWKRPDATDAAFFERDGKRFFRTGDMGRVDEEGYFFMTDRLKRMINASGFKVWPAEVEALMFRHPAIQEACVIAAKDAYRGETVKAVVVLRASHQGQETEESIIAWCRDNMAAYKVPRLVSFVDALPKSGSGKVMWRALQEAEAALAQSEK
jgi:acyl-CoA synthetase (AMP-forming)/AMP-acid ligase II